MQITVSSEEAFDHLIATREDVLVLGQGGSGKSYIIKQICQTQQCHVFAPTNQQASLIDGQTIYQFCHKTIQGIWYTGAIDTPFTLNTVIIDEVFMFKKQEMAAVLACCDLAFQLGGVRPRILMFGDEYQISATASCADDSPREFFYDAFDEEKLSQLRVIRLAGNRRCVDPELQKILDMYRDCGQTPQRITFIRSTTLRDAIQLVLKEGHTILVGTHEAQHRYQSLISKTLQNELTPTSSGTVCRGSDGRIWRVGETVFTTSFYGSIQREASIKEFVSEGATRSVAMLVAFRDSGKTIVVAPRLSGTQYKYDLVSGDVMVVDAVQGRTLRGVILDLQSFWGFGSYYVGISRVQRLTQLRLLTQPKEMFQVDLSNRYVASADQLPPPQASDLKK